MTDRYRAGPGHPPPCASPLSTSPSRSCRPPRAAAGSRPRPRRHREDRPHPPLAHHPPSLERILVDGRDAIVFGEIRQAVRSTGRACRARFVLHLTVEDGLVTRHSRHHGGRPGLLSRLGQ
ncbi:nuclear transport factor 2 family protein [Streptomyces sp. NRRL S-813]|uniref:nuclear transport factor 2 family protein n=1 Tax=Streptomyces sp. NRRL S-813 TaxID=1463919 RepID=UPI003B63BC70